MFVLFGDKNCNHYKVNAAVVLLAVLGLICFAAPAHSAITYMSGANVYSSGATASMPFTVSPNSNRVLIFAAGINNERPEYNIASVSFGIQYFTLLTRTAMGPGDGSGIKVELWYLANPVSGAGAVTVNQVTAMGKSMGVIEYSGVSGIGSSNTAAANANSLTVPLATAQGRSWIAGIFSQRNAAKMNLNPVTAGLVTRWDKQGKTPPINIYNHALGLDLPTATAGSYNMQVNSNRSSYCGMAAAELKAAKPAIISCVPAVGYIGGGTAVTITGANFDNGCTLIIGGNTAAVTYVNSTTLQISSPAHAAGAVDVIVTNTDSQSATGTAIFTYSPFQAPVVSSCTPSTGSTLGGQPVTITGSNFISGCTVSMGGIAATGVIFVNAATLVVTAPAHAAGLVNIVVTNPDTQTGTRLNAYTYVIPPPQVTSCSPAEGLTAGGQQITITGKYFVNGCTVTIGGSPATGVTFLDTMTLRVTTPAHAAGPADVAVRNPDAQTGTLVSGFTYFILPPPSVSSCLPSSGPTTGGQAITISGAGFTGGCTASIGGSLAAVTYISSSTLALVTPAHAAGTVGIIITNPDTQSASLPMSYTYAVPPTVLSCAPDSGSTAGGQAITLNGLNFRAGCSAYLDGVPCAITRVSAAQILLTTPAHAGGAVNVTVSNTDYTSGTLAAGFTYDGTPPVILLNGGGADVTIPCGGVYTETATASDNIDGDITSGLVIVIKDHLGSVAANVAADAPETYTITYDVIDTAMNAALRVTRTVRVTDQEAPVISLNGGGADVTLVVGDTYMEDATAFDDMDGDITAGITAVVRDHLGTIVAGVSTSAPETFTVTYDVSDAASNPAIQQSRIVRVAAKTLSSIAITQPASKLVYKTGEPLNINGLQVTGTYTDMSTAVLSVSFSDISGFDSSSAATGQVLTITKSGMTASYTVDIIGLVSIAITMPAAKLVYDIGQPLSVTGMVVTGTYTNSSTSPVTVTAADVSGFSSAAAQTGQVLTVTYGGKTTTYTVDIVPTLVSIAITTPASKLVYDIGETLSIAGMVVTGTYTDGSQKPESIIPANVTGLDTSAAETGQVLTVTYGGKTTTYTVDIVPTLAGIAITTPASKLVFNVGDELSIAGMAVTGTYTDGNTKPETVTVSNVTGFNSSVPATGQVLTVTVGTKSAIYTVDIVQPLLAGIAITTPAAKLVYTVGDALDITGMVVTGTYDDLSTKILPVTEANITGFSSLVPAAGQVLTITYDGKTTTYTVTIKALPPFVDICSPASGPASGGTAITLSGDNFVSGCTVTIGGIAATGVVFTDTMTLDMNTPAHVYGVVDITVTNPDGQQGTGYGIFTYTGPTFTPTATNTGTRTPTRTVTSTVTNTNTPALSSTDTPVYSSTATPSLSATGSRTQTGTATPVYSGTATPSSTVSATVTGTGTGTCTFTVSETHTISPTFTDTPEASATNTGTVTRTVTATATITATASATRTITHTWTVSSTPTVTPTTGYRQAAAGSSYVYPQPASGYINIVFESAWAGGAVISVYNAAGMPVAEFSPIAAVSAANKVRLDLSAFSPGVYYYIIRINGENYKVNKFLVPK